MVYFDVPLILPLVSNYGDVCEDIVLGAFGVKKPHQWQKEVFSHQFDMMKELRVNKQPCFPSILCVPTGSGKSKITGYMFRIYWWCYALCFSFVVAQRR